MANRFSKERVAHSASPRRGNSILRLWNTRGVLTLLFLPVLFAACAEQPEVTAPEGGATIEKVEEETDEYIGKKVTVNGEIARIVNPRAFIIRDDEFLGGEDVLVVSATEVPLVEDTLARVTGTARELNIVEFEKEYGFDLEPELEAELKERPAIVATETTLMPQLETIAQNPVPFLGRTVTIEGEVEEVIAPGAIRIDNNEVLSEDLLVVSANPIANIKEGSEVAITGTVRRVTAVELEKEFNLGPATEYEVYVKKLPVIVAETTREVE